MSFYSDLAQIRPKLIAHVIYQNVQDSEALRLKSAQIFHDFFSNPQSRGDLNTIENQTKHRNRIRKPRSIKVRILHNGTIKFGVNFHNDYYISSTEVVFCEVILTRLSFPKELLLAIKYATCLESLLSLLSLYLSSAILLLTCEI